MVEVFMRLMVAFQETGTEQTEERTDAYLAEERRLASKCSMHRITHYTAEMRVKR